MLKCNGKNIAKITQQSHATDGEILGGAEILVNNR